QLFTILQVTIPKEYQGRIFSTLMTVIKSIMPLGLIIWGALGDAIDLTFVFIVPPVLSIVAFLILIQTTQIFQFDAMHAPIPEVNIPEPQDEEKV
ncbi:MAG: hypothetical protein ACTSRD_13800, partial [Promethearchaeota archaeon]